MLSRVRAWWPLVRSHSLRAGYFGAVATGGASVGFQTEGAPIMFEDDPLGLGGGLGSAFGGSGGSGLRGMASRKPKVPVTILTGFLGAGKTTMVQHILRNREGLKVGVVINDVAEANVDSAFLSLEDADGIVGLQNGCACCSGRDDLFARMQELVESTGIAKLDKPWDRLVVECSGVAEPESIARELEAMAARGEPVMKKIFLAGIVCVIDASTFREAYNSVTKADAGDAGEVPLTTLLVNQVESADTIVLNKADLVDRSMLAQVAELIGALSPNARQLEASHGAVPLRTLLPAGPVDLDMPAYVPTLANRHSVAVRTADAHQDKQQARLREKDAASAHTHEEEACGHSHGTESAHGECGHDHGNDSCHDSAHQGAHSHSSISHGGARHERYGLTSFVYRSGPERHFDVVRLAACARQMPVSIVELGLPGAGTAEPQPAEAFRGVLRSKGFVRCADGNAYYWSFAGRQIHVTQCPAPVGKGQEIVFIGVRMDAEAITKALDECLVPTAEAML